MAWAGAVVTALLASAAATDLRAATVKVLAQQRVEGLARLLDSLEASRYPAEATIELEIWVDGLPSTVGEAQRARRRETAALARARSSRWPFGPSRVVDSGEHRGVRGQWLACANPSVFHDEMARVLIVEDDVEVSPAWFEFLSRALEAPREPGLAGVSLQRQPYRLDAYASDMDHGRRQGSMMRLFDDEADEAYAFAHVGSWAFSPEPRVWLEFIHWFRGLDHTDPDTWSVASDGSPRRDAVESNLPFTESLPSRWYRAALASGKRKTTAGAADESSMWTAHFGAFMAARQLFVVHARLRGGAALAISYRSDGAHYSLEKADSRLFSEASLPADLFGAPTMPRLALSGERVQHLLTYVADADEATLRRRAMKRRAFERFSGGDRRLQSGDDDDLAIFYTLTNTVAESDVAGAVQGLGFGHDPFTTLTQQQALCVLDGKKVAIVGDSISRYFTWEFNWFLRNGDVSAEFVSGVSTDATYYDQNSPWTDEGYRSSSAKHRQNMVAVPSSYFDGLDESIETAFWFVQDTWYDAFADLATTIADYDVLIMNSGWWERQDSTLDDGSYPDDVDCADDKMFADGGACLTAYESDLEALYDGLLSTFQTDPEKAVIFRLSSCCGGGPYSTDAETDEGSIAVSAMNAVAQRVFTDLGVELLDVEHLISNVNINIDRSSDSDIEDPRDRTFDGTHPRASQLYAWSQMLISKIAKQLDRVDSCNLEAPATEAPTTEAPTSTAPTTPAPTRPPTAKPTFSLAPTTESCSNGAQDAGETDIDCGGDTCAKCADNRGCESGTDCRSAVCFESVCVASPTPAPSAEPSTKPTAPPTPRPSTPAPTAKPTVSLAPSPAPNARPTLPPPVPTPGADSCEDSYAGCPPPTPVEFCQGNTCFACIDVQDDGVRYKRSDSETDRLFGDNCPTAGQRLLLSLFLACLAALAVACYVTPAGNKLCADLFGCRRGDAYQSGGARDALEDEAHPRVVSHPGAAPPRPNAALEDELSGSALMVLKQMEAQEQNYRNRGDEVEMTATRPDKTSSLGAIAEDEPVDIADLSQLRGGTAQQQQQQQQQQANGAARNPYQYLPTQQPGSARGSPPTKQRSKTRRVNKQRDSKSAAAQEAAEAANAADLPHPGRDAHVTFAPNVARPQASNYRQRSFNRNNSEDEASLLRRSISLSSDDWARGLDDTAEVVNTLANFGRTTSVHSDHYETTPQPQEATPDGLERHEIEGIFEAQHSFEAPQHPSFPPFAQRETA